MLDVEVRLEVLAARLRDGVDGGDEQRTVLPPGGAAARVLHVRRDVGVAAESVRVLGRDAAAGRQSPVQSSTHDDDVARRTRRTERLRRTEHLCTVHTQRSRHALVAWRSGSVVRRVNEVTCMLYNCLDWYK